jgi:hypothetical protein
MLGANVTYCFKVTNGASQPVTNVTLRVPELNYTNRMTGVLATTSSSWSMYLETRITSTLTNYAYGSARGSSPQGVIIPTMAELTDVDPSGVGLLHPTNSVIKIENTVYITGSNKGGTACGNIMFTKEYVEGTR